MKRLLPCAVVALAAGLVPVPTALASVGARHSDRTAAPPGLAAPARSHAGHGGVPLRAAPPLGATAPLGAAPTYDIKGHVLAFSGSAVSGAEVDWGWFDTRGYHRGTSYYPTGTTGAFSFTGIPGGHTWRNQPSDALHVYYYPSRPGLEGISDWSLDFSADNGSSYSYDMRPARVQVKVTDGVSAGATIEVRAGNDNEGYALADVPLSAGAGWASVLPSTTSWSFDDLTAYSYVVDHDGAKYDMVWGAAEWAGAPVAVGPGKTAPGTISLDWDQQSQWSQIAGPTCRHSGAPGRTLIMQLHGWPAGQVASFEAWYGSRLTTFYGYPDTSNVTSSDPGTTYTTPLRVYAHAPVGIYEIDTWRSDIPSLLDLWDLYQVTSFKASAGAVRPGGAVRLSGKVPGSGTATLYSTTRKVTRQPATLAATGWHRAGSCRISDRAFASGSLHPKRTTWYVAKYKGDAFWAFTQVVKVTVR